MQAKKNVDFFTGESSFSVDKDVGRAMLTGYVYLNRSRDDRCVSSVVQLTTSRMSQLTCLLDRDSTKLIFTFLLNRVNTITGRRYGDDPSILAWETGNELQHNFKGNLPAPGDWTGESA